MTITNRPYGTMDDGTAVTCWTLTNDAGMTAEIIDYGATVRSIVVPDKNGKPVDVVTADCERDNFMTAQEAMEYGLVDKVIERR